MRFVNRTEYTRNLFLAVYNEELKKIILVLRAVAGIGFVVSVYALVKVISEGNLRLGDYLNPVLATFFLLLSAFLPNLMAANQMKKCKKANLHGVHTLRFTGDVLNMSYEHSDAPVDLSLSGLTAVKEVGGYLRLTIGDKSTYLDPKGFEYGTYGAFLIFIRDWEKKNNALRKKDEQAKQDAEDAELEEEYQADMERIAQEKRDRWNRRYGYHSGDPDEDDEEEEEAKEEPEEEAAEEFTKETENNENSL